MPLTGKYLKYSPEITLEIFTLVYSKLIENKWSSINVKSLYDQFIGNWNYIVDHNYGKQFYSSVTNHKLKETTVQEILGYDPFAKEEVKQPLKQAVHCKTQEEWDFACDKYSKNDIVKGQFGKDYNSFNYSGKFRGWTTFESFIKQGYQILSFQEWCDLNGYKMESNQEFKVGDVVVNYENSISYNKNEICVVSKINKTHLACENKPQTEFSMKPFRCFRHATPEEINNHLISIGQIPAGEPLNTGIEPDKDGMFKYTIVGGNSFNGKCSTSITRTTEIIKPATIEFNYLPEPK